MEFLRYTVKTCPVIDNHAHNLLRYDQLQAHSFLSLVSEAHGEALGDSTKSLPHLRAVKQLAPFFNAAENWPSVIEKRAEALANDPDTLTRECLQDVHTILIDDGLDPDSVYPLDWHDQFVKAPTRRILRIESEAEKILKDVLGPFLEKQSKPSVKTYKEMFSAFGIALRKVIEAALQDQRVAGFKSIIAYRTGLSISDSNPHQDLLITAFQTLLERGATSGSYRLNDKVLNDFIMRFSLQLLNESSNPKPVQFHTGLGDNDLRLHLADPAHLQPVIEQFPNVPFVLLHSSYPYTRNAGYLAAVYHNVYLDFGLAFPMLSRDGQETALAMGIELAPGNKLLYSSDGHWFPETYWLALVQFRSALEKVLCHCVFQGDMSTSAAVELARGILYDNANRIYRLEAAELSGTISSAPSAADKLALQAITSESDMEALRVIERQDKPLGFVYVQWIDRMGTMRARVVPIKEFRRLVESGSRLGISLGNTGTLQNDTFTSVVNTCGQIYLKLAFRSLRRTHYHDTLRSSSLMRPPRSSATIMAGWCDEDGVDHYACPRGCLSRIYESIKHDFGISILVGFEIEVTFLRRSTRGGGEVDFEPITTNHAWGTLTTEQWSSLDLHRDIADGLEEIGIDIQQFHAEAGPGQFEFVLPPAAPCDAVDALYQARQVVSQIAAHHGVVATLHPQPFPGAGSGAHAHTSLDPADREMDFWGGVVDHLEAVCAFTMPEAASYSRVVDGHWTGGTWIAWGTQNRETPLRRVKSGRWEVRCLDGFANMYLALASVLAAGYTGLKSGGGMALKDCNANPSHLSDAQRQEFGITKNLPKDIESSMAALRSDKALQSAIGEKMVDEYMIMKEVEQKMLQDMPEDKRHTWLLDRY